MTEGGSASVEQLGNAVRTAADILPLEEITAASDRLTRASEIIGRVAPCAGNASLDAGRASLERATEASYDAQGNLQRYLGDIGASGSETICGSTAARKERRTQAVDKAIGAIGSHPAKIATLLALDRLDGRPAGVMDIISAVNEAMGDDPELQLRVGDSSQFKAYCTQSLVRAGFVEETTKESQRGTRGATQTTAAFVITPEGSEAVAVAEALGRWEANHPEISLRELCGSARHRPGSPAERGPLTRLAIVARLAGGPRDGAALTELLEANGDNLTEHHVRQLHRLGVIEQLSKSVPAHRQLAILDPAMRNMGAFTGNMSAEMRALYITAAGLRAQGVERINGELLLRELSKVAPRINPNAAWKALLAHQPNCLAFIDLDEFGPRAYRTKYRIADTYRAAMLDLLKTVTALRGQNNTETPTYDRRLFDDAAAVKKLIDKAYGRTRRRRTEGGTSTRQAITESIPAGGITVNDLLAKVLGRQAISIMTLRNHLKDAPGIHVESVVQGIGSARKVGWVTLWARRFPNDWHKKAACTQKDAERFFPISTAGLSAEATKQAKTVCRTCPVRPACLKTAVDRGEADGIWGGLTEKARRALPPEVRQLLGTVTIAK